MTYLNIKLARLTLALWFAPLTLQALSPHDNPSGEPEKAASAASVLPTSQLSTSPDARMPFHQTPLDDHDLMKRKNANPCK